MKKADNIRFDSKEGRFYGISESDVKQWKEQYPYIDFDDLDKQIEKAGQSIEAAHFVPDPRAIGTGLFGGGASMKCMEHVRENPRENLEDYFFAKDFNLYDGLSDKQKESIERKKSAGTGGGNKVINKPNGKSPKIFGDKFEVWGLSINYKNLWHKIKELAMWCR